MLAHDASIHRPKPLRHNDLRRPVTVAPHIQGLWCQVNNWVDSPMKPPTQPCHHANSYAQYEPERPSARGRRRACFRHERIGSLRHERTQGPAAKAAERTRRPPPRKGHGPMPTPARTNPRGRGAQAAKRTRRAGPPGKVHERMVRPARTNPRARGTQAAKRTRRACSPGRRHEHLLDRHGRTRRTLAHDARNEPGPDAARNARTNCRRAHANPGRLRPFPSACRSPPRLRR